MPEFWQKTTRRAEQTLAVWRQFLPLLKVGATDATQHAADVAALATLAQARALRRTDARAARQRELAAFYFIRTLNLAVPKLIEGGWPAGHALRQALSPIYKIVPRSDALNLQRARMLIPIWRAANADLAARKPGDALVRGVTGVEEFAQAVRDYPGRQQASAEMETALALARTELRTLNRKIDRMNKRAYMKLKAEARSNPALETTLLATVTRHNRKRPTKGGT